MSKTGRGPGDCLGPVPASDIDLSVDVDAPSFMAEWPDGLSGLVSCPASFEARQGESPSSLLATG